MTRAIALCLLLVGCAHAVRPEPVPTLRWASPVANVVASDDMSPTCRASVLAAVSFFRGLGRDMTLTFVDADHPSIILEPREGEISIRAGFTSDPKAAGQTSAYTLGNGMIGRAEIVLSDCDPFVSAHELAHAMGLEHSDSRSNLMWFSTEKRQWGLTREQLTWITQCRRAE